MNNPPLKPHEVAAADKSREPHRSNQPYASELDDRELEHAHKEKRPVSPNGATSPENPPAQSKSQAAPKP